MPVNRLIQAQEILISKLSKYLHLVSVQSRSIQDEDVEKLVNQTEAGRVITEEIVSLNKTVLGILGDIIQAGLFSESIEIQYEKDRKACSDLIAQIEEQSTYNRNQLSSLKDKYLKSIEIVEKTVSADMKKLLSTSFPDVPELVDIEA